MVARQMKGLEFYILYIDRVINKAAKDAFKDKNKLNDDELKHVYDSFDALSRSQFSFVNNIRNFFKGCFFYNGIGGYSKNKKKAIECFEIAAKSGHKETKKLLNYNLLISEVPKKIRLI
ncbi:hypothetical protein F8M41_021432 [Gigaspora margarita]|uniref:Uncharacterized protein n=1 Tax=Gigaspora margarita TaxID=4874 RepID=A0A8H4AGT4_GIGMA|nr:hypothetical protein F8M41_021432 [Gigaspora margarita]